MRAVWLQRKMYALAGRVETLTLLSLNIPEKFQAQNHFANSLAFTSHRRIYVFNIDEKYHFGKVQF